MIDKPQNEGMLLYVCLACKNAFENYVERNNKITTSFLNRFLFVCMIFCEKIFDNGQKSDDTMHILIDFCNRLQPLLGFFSNRLSIFEYLLIMTDFLKPLS